MKVEHSVLIFVCLLLLRFGFRQGKALLYRLTNGFVFANVRNTVVQHKV